MTKNKKEYQKKYRSDPKNAEKAKIAIKEYAKTPGRIAYRAEYRLKNKEREKDANLMRKNAVLDALGGKCIKCGFSDYRALQIDHVNADGFKDRSRGFSNGTFYYQRVLISFIKKEGRFQLLCANCNWIKRFENNEHIARK